MIVPIDKHIEFYKAEYAKQWQEWELYIQTQIRLLLVSKEREMYISSVWGIEPKSDLLILKVRNISKPRLRVGGGGRFILKSPLLALSCFKDGCIQPPYQ